eukprot:1335703-Rhodomonas_salina.1
MAGDAKARASGNIVKVLLEADLADVDHAEDDLLAAFCSEELHMDYAHVITLGCFKEQYYLLFVVGCSNFMWATLMITRMEPEELLQDFFSGSVPSARTTSSQPRRHSRRSA